VLPARDFPPLVGVFRHTLYAWNRKFQPEEPVGLEDRPRGSPPGSRLPEVTRRAILMMKESRPDWGLDKISAMLLRGPTLPACPQAVARVLREARNETGKALTRPHPDHPRQFEHACPNQLWPTGDQSPALLAGCQAERAGPAWRALPARRGSAPCPNARKWLSSADQGCSMGRGGSGWHERGRPPI
jgi:hypothetical protein